MLIVERKKDNSWVVGREMAMDSNVANGENYLGIGIDTAFPAPRSAIQIVSPAGSPPVGVLSPSLSTVTLALSPFMVRAEILPLAFSARRSLPFAARMPSGPFISWSVQISTGAPGLPV